MNYARYDIKKILVIFIYLAFTPFFFAQNQSSSFYYDIVCYNIDLNVNDTSTLIYGNSTIHLKNISGNLPFINLELSNNLLVDSVFVNETPVLFYHDSDTLKIINEINQHTPAIYISVYYQGDGKGEKKYGVNNTYIEKWDQHFTWTMGEPFYAKNWFPVKQDLNDKADSVIVSIIVDSALQAVSNGILYNIQDLPNNKTKYTWKSKYPIIYYLISFVVSDYLEYYYTIPLENDTLLFVNYIYNDTSYFNQEKENIDITVDLIKLYSDLFGPYPFIDEKYGHAIAPVGGGMEHQTISTISDFRFELIAHELAHQWWGNFVTCSSWKDIWINEGFASYSEYLAYEFLFSKEQADEWLLETITNILTNNSGSVYISDFPDSVSRIFNHRLSYDKGAMIIHLLRKKIDNDQLFFNILKSYLNEYAYRSSGAEEFKAIAEQISGLDLDNFFNSWYYGDGFPEINIQWQQIKDELIIYTEQDRNFETKLQYRINFFAREDTVINHIISGFRAIDTFSIEGIVHNIMLYPIHDHLLLLNGISRIPNSTFTEDINIIYDYINKEWEIFFYRSSEYEIKFYNLQGNLIKDDISLENYYNIPASNLTKGLYIIEIKEKDKVYRKKVINY